MHFVDPTPRRHAHATFAPYPRPNVELTARACERSTFYTPGPLSVPLNAGFWRRARPRRGTVDAVVLALVAVAFVAIVVWMLLRRRRGGYGPPIPMPALTRAGRERTNRSYARHGWAKPYDEDGNLLPERERTPPDRPGGP